MEIKRPKGQAPLIVLNAIEAQAIEQDKTPIILKTTFPVGAKVAKWKSREEIILERTSKSR